MLNSRFAAMLSAALLGAVAAVGAAQADPTLEFDGQIALGGGVSTAFVALYTYDPSTASTYTTGGGDVVTQYDLTEASLSFGGSTYPVVSGEMDGGGFVSFDENASSDYEIFEGSAGQDNYSYFNTAEIDDGQLGQAAGSMFNVFSGDSVTRYKMTVDHVSATPEPASWALVVGGVALAGMALRGRRRGDATAPAAG